MGICGSTNVEEERMDEKSKKEKIRIKTGEFVAQEFVNESKNEEKAMKKPKSKVPLENVENEERAERKDLVISIKERLEMSDYLSISKILEGKQLGDLFKGSIEYEKLIEETMNILLEKPANLPWDSPEKNDERIRHCSDKNFSKPIVNESLPENESEKLPENESEKSQEMKNSELPPRARHAKTKPEYVTINSDPVEIEDEYLLQLFDRYVFHGYDIRQKLTNLQELLPKYRISSRQLYQFTIFGEFSYISDISITNHEEIIKSIDEVMITKELLQTRELSRGWYRVFYPNGDHYIGEICSSRRKRKGLYISRESSSFIIGQFDGWSHKNLVSGVIYDEKKKKRYVGNFDGSENRFLSGRIYLLDRGEDFLEIEDQEEFTTTTELSYHSKTKKKYRVYTGKWGTQHHHIAFCGDTSARPPCSFEGKIIDGETKEVLFEGKLLEFVNEHEETLKTCQQQREKEEMEEFCFEDIEEEEEEDVYREMEKESRLKEEEERKKREREEEDELRRSEEERRRKHFSQPFKYEDVPEFIKSNLLHEEEIIKIYRHPWIVMNHPFFFTQFYPFMIDTDYSFNYTFFRYFLDEKKKKNKKEEEESTFGHTEEVRYLLDRVYRTSNRKRLPTIQKQEYNYCRGDGRTYVSYLQFPLEQENDELFDVMILYPFISASERIGYSNRSDSHHSTSLFECIKAGDYSKVKNLLERKEEVVLSSQFFGEKYSGHSGHNYKYSIGYIQMAYLLERYDLVRLLYDFGAVMDEEMEKKIELIVWEEQFRKRRLVKKEEEEEEEQKSTNIISKEEILEVYRWVMMGKELGSRVLWKTEEFRMYPKVFRKRIVWPLLLVSERVRTLPIEIIQIILSFVPIFFLK